MFANGKRVITGSAGVYAYCYLTYADGSKAYGPDPVIIRGCFAFGTFVKQWGRDEKNQANVFNKVHCERNDLECWAYYLEIFSIFRNTRKGNGTLGDESGWLFVVH